MRRLNSSRQTLITLLSFVTVHIPQSMALWTLLFAYPPRLRTPPAHCVSLKCDTGVLTLREMIRDLLSGCWDNPPAGAMGRFEGKQTRPEVFLGNHLAQQAKGQRSRVGWGNRSPCLFLPRAYLPPQHPTHQPRDYLHLTRERRAGEAPICLREPGSPDAVTFRVHAHIHVRT